MVDESAYPTLPDSLALVAPGGTEVWFSGARLGSDSQGGTCTERGLVIVRAESRILVPLLMTGVPPTLVDDSTIRARMASTSGSISAGTSTSQASLAQLFFPDNRLHVEQVDDARE